MTNMEWDNDRNTMVHSNPDPILNSRQYVVELEDGTEAELTANTIAQSMYDQRDPDSNQYLMLDYIVDFRRSTTVLCYADQNLFKNGRTYRSIYTAVQQLLLQWKDGQTYWQKLADLKESHLIETAEYAIYQNLQGETAFNWWVPHFIKKRRCIILLVKKWSERYFKKTHEFGVRLLKSVDKAYKLDT